MLRSLIGVGCVLFISCATAPRPGPVTEQAQAPAPGPRRFLSPAELMQLMQDSQVQYRVDAKDSPPGGWADQLWPLQVAPVYAPQVVLEEGHRVIREWQDDPRAQGLIVQAEEHYQARRYAQATQLYEKALEVCPRCYLARAYLGDAKLFGGDPEGALADYRKAAEQNPDDYRLYYFQGSALARMGRLEEARDAFAESLVLNPRNPILRQFFEQNRGMGLVIQDDVLVVRGFAHQEATQVAVEFDPDYGPAWMAFANCKAVWLAEPAHRKEVTGRQEHQFSSLEETECLISAAMVHASQAQKGGEGATDESLDRLVGIIQERSLDELILFELAARVHPQFTLTLDAAERQRLKQYVLRHVLVPVRRL